MQNGTYPWMAPTTLGQKSWPGYQASLTDLFLKKNPLQFGSGISQLAAASSYLEKMTTLNDHGQKCPHPDAKDKPYPCEICQQYSSLCSSLKSESGPSNARPMSAPPDQKPPQQIGHHPPHSHPPPPPPLPSSQALARRTQNSMVPNGNRARQQGNKQFLCPVCQKCFTQKGNLKTHMMIHTGEKPYSCQVCGKSFTQKGNVDTHMKIHTGEKDFACENCGKRFTQKGNLKTHIRSVHTKEKPFACGVCGKCFSQKGNMQTHMRTHNKDDRFPCTLCGKTFSQKGNLKTHMQRHTGQLPPRRYGSRGSRTNAAHRLAQQQQTSTCHPTSHPSPYPLQQSPAASQASAASPLGSPVAPSHPSAAQVSRSATSHQQLNSPPPSVPKHPQEPPQQQPPQCRASSPPSSHMGNSLHCVMSDRGVTQPSPSHTSHHHPITSPPPGDTINHTLMPLKLCHNSSQPSRVSVSLANDNLGNHPIHSPPPPNSSQHSRIKSPSPSSSSGLPPAFGNCSRPFYSAPPTPVPTPLPHPSSWLTSNKPRPYDNFQPTLSSYGVFPQHPTPLSRLSLLASQTSSHHHLTSPLLDDKQQPSPPNHGHSSVSESQFQSGNPDFSQLLD